MLTITEPGDTSRSIAYRVLNKPDEGYAKKLRAFNQDSLAYTSAPDDYYLSDQLVWCPDFSLADQNPALRQLIQNEVNFIPSLHRYYMGCMLRDGIDFNALIGIAKAVSAYNQIKANTNPILASAMGIQGSSQILSRGIDRFTDPATEVLAKMNILDEKLKDLVNLNKQIVRKNIRITRQTFKAAYESALSSLTKHGKLLQSINVIKSTPNLMTAKRLEKLGTKHGILIHNLFDFQVFRKIATYGKWLSRSCLAFSIAMGVDEVYETYQANGDWFAKAVGVGLEIGSVLAGAFLLSLAFTPTGWIILAGTTIAEGIGLTLASNFIEKEGEKLGKWLVKI